MADIVTEDELGAFVDGQLGPARTAEVEHLMKESADARAKVARIRAQRSALSNLFGGVAGEPLPADMRELLRRLQ